MKKHALSRRHFLKKSALASGVFIVPRRFLAGADGTPPSEQFRCAGAGAGGNMCRNDLRRVIDEAKGSVVALADPWKLEQWQGLAKENRQELYPDATIYRDYREMLDKEKLDGIVVATNDNWHAKVSMDAMRRGLNVYTEKPLALTVAEVRMLAKAAKKYKVATQMGNNGHAGDWIRTTCEHIWAGTVGKIREVHAWSDRAGTHWAQGIGRPTDTPPVPKELDWDMWLGPAQKRPYHPKYTRLVWRGWCDLGTGALGDMGCHILDSVYWGMKLGHPTTVEATTTLHSPEAKRETFPVAAHITYQFPARDDMPALRLKWFDGGLQPPAPPGFPAGEKLPPNGVIFYGDKGIMYQSVFQYPKFLGALAEAPKPKETIERCPSHYLEWVREGKGSGKPCGSNFQYAAGLTEMVLLGTIAARVGGAERLAWDGDNMRFTNHEAATAMLSREYRKGWEI
jgi:predicted dehydrogenase